MPFLSKNPSHKTLIDIVNATNTKSVKWIKDNQDIYYSSIPGKSFDDLAVMLNIALPCYGIVFKNMDGELLSIAKHQGDII